MKTLYQTIEKLNRKKYGFSDLLDNVYFETNEFWSYSKGGGFFFGNNTSNTYDTIHVVPHGGSYIPRWCLDFFKHLNEDKLAQLIIDNNDNCTTEITKSLIGSLSQKKGNVCIAYFNISRILIDANRGFKDAQVSRELYKGKHPIQRKNLNIISERLRNELLLPWLNEVNRLIKLNQKSMVIHHHTFDIKGAKSLIHDKNPFGLRPVSQFFYKKPEYTENSKRLEYNGTFLSLQLLNKIKDIAQKYLNMLSSEKIEIRIDNPLIAPIMPYAGTSTVPGSNKSNPLHFIYELRKDILSRRKDVDIWCECIDKIEKIHVEPKQYQNTN